MFNTGDRVVITKKVSDIIGDPNSKVGIGSTGTLIDHPWNDIGSDRFVMFDNGEKWFILESCMRVIS